MKERNLIYYLAGRRLRRSHLGLVVLLVACLSGSNGFSSTSPSSSRSTFGFVAGGSRAVLWTPTRCGVGGSRASPCRRGFQPSGISTLAMNAIPGSDEAFDGFLSNGITSHVVATDATMASFAEIPPEAMDALPPSTSVLIFALGLAPFVIAAIEFWRRITFGQSFGTGSDSVIIVGEDDAPEKSRGRRVLGKGALLVAYALFAIAAGVVGLVLYSVLTTPVPSTA